MFVCCANFVFQGVVEKHVVGERLLVVSCWVGRKKNYGKKVVSY